MPIAWQTIRFLNHPESMIRNTVRNIILSVLRLKDTTAINYLTNFPFVIYYSHLASFMRMYWDNLNQIMETELYPFGYAETPPTSSMLWRSTRMCTSTSRTCSGSRLTLSRDASTTGS